MGSFIKIVDMANQDAHIFKGASQASLGAGDPDIVPHCIADVCPILGNKGGIIGVFVAFVLPVRDAIAQLLWQFFTGFALLCQIFPATCPKTEAFEQGGACQSVGAVEACAGAFANGAEAS